MSICWFKIKESASECWVIGMLRYVTEGMCMCVYVCVCACVCVCVCVCVCIVNLCMYSDGVRRVELEAVCTVG